MATLTFVLIRHGQSVGNQQQRMIGQGNDALTEGGKQQVIQLAAWLQREAVTPTAVYSSPLRRAAQTSELLVAPLDPISIQLCDDLREMHNGIFQGLTWAEAKAQYSDLCRRLETTLDWLPIPGAESLDAARDRAHRLIHRLLQRHIEGGCIWMISHSGILQHLIAEILGCDRTWGLSIPNTALFEFQIESDRWIVSKQTSAQNRDPTVDHNRWNTELWKIRHFNSTLHLQAQRRQSYGYGQLG